MAAVVVAGRHLDRQVDDARAPRRRSSAPRRRCCPCTATSPSPTCRCRTRPGAESCGRSRAACRCARRSRARSPLSLRLALRARRRRVCAAPMMMTSFAMTGAACRPMSPVIGSISWSFSGFRSTMPSLPKPGTRMPVLRVERHHLVARRHVDDALVACRRSSTRGRGPRAGAAPPRRACPRPGCASTASRRSPRRARRRRAASRRS